MMKWIVKLTRITAYVSQCANAISKAAQALGDNWPTDSPFDKPANNTSTEKTGVAMGSQAK